MKLGFKNPLFWLCLALAHTGCTSLLMIDKTKPAEVPVTDAQWKVVALNRFNPDELQFKREKKTAVYSDGAQHAFAGVLDAIDADRTYVLQFADTAAYTLSGSSEALTPAQVQEVYQAHPHHLLLTLNYFDAYMEPMVVDVEDEEGVVSKIADYSLFTKTTWTLYDSTGAVLDHEVLSRDELYTSRSVLNGLMAVLIKPAISNAGTSINALAAQTGIDYWQRLSPQPVTMARPYYAHKAFAPAAAQMAAGNWAAAITLLMPLAESDNNKEAGKAAYNLAVVCEAKGDLEAAKRWAKTAAGKKNKLALNLLSDLQNW